jgi:coenzyme F420-dependent glucose-6-phosphate dehydrogenase
MAEFGFSLSSEEHRPADLVRQAARAEEAGFSFAVISDHFHPWTDRQGQSPFVWCVIGAIAQATGRLRLGTGVTCPLIRMHPGIVAQAAATAASLMEGRFFLGVGAGENLNEHIFGARWPSSEERREMLEEAVEVMRLLWKGEKCSHRGRHYTIDEARLYTIPEEPIELYMAAAAQSSAELAGRVADGMIGTDPDAELVSAFSSAGGKRKPRYGQATVCWAESEEEAKRIVCEQWPNSALEGSLSWELKTPQLIESAAKNVRADDLAQSIVCGPDPARHVEKIEKFLDAGYDHVYIHQIGHDQEGFIRFYEREVLPQVS